jgi:hypothetical protein
MTKIVIVARKIQARISSFNAAFIPLRAWLR